MSLFISVPGGRKELCIKHAVAFVNDRRDVQLFMRINTANDNVGKLWGHFYFSDRSILFGVLSYRPVTWTRQ